MPVVAVEVEVHAPADLVWSAVVDISSYPSYMENVQSVVLELVDASGVRRSRWSVLLKGSVLEWIEDEVVDHERMLVTFHQVDGDLQHLAGTWLVTPRNEGHSRVELTVDFEIGIPLLADMLNPVAERALRENSERMLREIEARATALSVEAGEGA